MLQKITLSRAASICTLILLIISLIFLSLGFYLIGLTHGTGYAQCFHIPRMEILRCD